MPCVTFISWRDFFFDREVSVAPKAVRASSEHLSNGDSCRSVFVYAESKSQEAREKPSAVISKQHHVLFSVFQRPTDFLRM